MRTYNRENSYDAFSLIEMLITIIILGFILLTCALVLTTLIKVSTVSTNKTRVRTESEYMQELLRRTIRTTDPANANIYNSIQVRTFDPATSTVISDNIEETYNNPLEESIVGNEIHLRPYGSSKWICVGFFYGKNNEMESDGKTRKGYVLKTTMDSNNNYSPASCFDPTQNSPYNYIVLNSRFVNVSNMEILFTRTEDENKEFILNVHSNAIYWYFAKGAPLSRSVFRQSIVKTEGVMW